MDTIDYKIEQILEYLKDSNIDIEEPPEWTHSHVYFKILNEELTAEDMQFLILHSDFLYAQMEVKDDSAWLTLAFKI